MRFTCDYSWILNTKCDIFGSLTQSRGRHFEKRVEKMCGFFKLLVRKGEVT